MTKLPAALMREVKAEFKAQRESYISGYIEAHLSDVFSISDFYPVILTTLQQAILDGYTIADYDRQPFYNAGEPAIRIVLNRKQDEIEAHRTALTTEAEAQLMASLMAQAEEYYTQAVAEEERRQRAEAAAQAAAAAEAQTFASRLRVALADTAR
ncbi:hypothetical protein NGC52_10035 [Klebsiella michiganensis]|uniref:hypothetical protein n=1 Tax=Enterobacteriaceae TaxID=543 RepID=UPI0007CC93D1|nr:MULTISPECIES: hypothetical protein [Klebsiella]QLU03197.1 hypothetical protein HV256_04225 [Klebsiella oxytoca]MDV1012903.1 hypothetical protein [Klebsiella grimontii]MDV1023606.1 hypothetical protein [Klebsiella grimontii]MDV1040177.1 hypothetical protein [Klebsiella grimontii]MDV1105336.1 hypothetical protein [Klebsiella grimontii]